MMKRAPASVRASISAQGKTVNNHIRANQIKNVSASRISPTGYVVTCTICNTVSKPTPVPDTILMNCNCQGN